MNRRWRRALGILWPAFLGACVLEILVFGLVDPQALHTPGGGAFDLQAQTIYSLGFLAFWLICAAVAWMTQRLAEPAFEVNSRALD